MCIRDSSKVTLHSLRAQMGIMLQDSFIFSGTIMDNIRYGRLDATDEEIIAAAKTCLLYTSQIHFFKSGTIIEHCESLPKVFAEMKQMPAR